MKIEEKKKARYLRTQGASINEIVRAIGVSKASVSVWVRDIQLTPKQRARIASNNLQVDVLERRRETRMAKTKERRRILGERAALRISHVSERDIMMLGIALYWGEGAKKKHGSLELANSDPRVVKMTMLFFRKILHVPECKFHIRVQAYAHTNKRKIEEYWSSVTGVPTTQFQKMSVAVSRASQQKKDSTPYGTCTIGVYDTEREVTLKAWIDRVCALAGAAI